MKMQKYIVAACVAALAAMETTAQWNVIQPNQDPARTLNATPPAQPQRPQPPQAQKPPQRPAPPQTQKPNPPAQAQKPNPPAQKPQQSQRPQAPQTQKPQATPPQTQKPATPPQTQKPQAPKPAPPKPAAPPPQAQKPQAPKPAPPKPAAPPPQAQKPAPQKPAASPSRPMQIATPNNRPGSYHFIPYERSYAIAPSSFMTGYYADPYGYEDWLVFVGQFSASGTAKEILVADGEYTEIRLELVSGTVSVNTVWIRPEKTEVRIASRLQAGQPVVIDLGEVPRRVTGLRISDNGRGEYRIFAR